MKSDVFTPHSTFTWTDYTVYAALRGPDLQGNELHSEELTLAALKRHVTRRIRAVAFSASSLATCVGDFNIDHVRTALEEIDVAKWRHYLLHLHEAVLYTEGHPIWQGQGAKLAGLLGDANYRGSMIKRNL